MTFTVNGYVIDGTTLTLVNTPTVTVNPGLTATINAPLDGTAGLNKAGTGTLVLGGTNTFTGTSTFSAGTVRLTDSNALQNTTVNLSGGTITFAAGLGTAVLGGLSGSTNFDSRDTDGATV